MGRRLKGHGVVKFGLVGSADILGITSDGIFLAFEAKTGAGVQRKEQIAFEMMIHRFGGRYHVVRTAQEAKEYLDGLGLPSTKVTVVSCHQLALPESPNRTE